MKAGKAASETGEMTALEAGAPRVLLAILTAGS